MHKSTIITLLLAFVSLTGQATTIEDSPREHTEQWLTKNNIKGEHIYVTHNEWNLLAAKFNFYAIPFSIGVDKDGNIVSFDEVNK